jgi:hypothetical protein
MTASDLEDIQEQSANAFGVSLDDVHIEAVYQTTGSIEIDITDESLIPDLVEELEEELAGILGIHEGNVDVTIEEGIAYYTITSDSVQSAMALQDVISDPSTTTILNENLAAGITSVDVEQDIMAEIVVTIDSTGARNNRNNAAETLEENFHTQGYVAIVENVFITSAPTLLPTITPSIPPVTSIPSAVPTITGAITSVSMSGPATSSMTRSEINSISSDIAEIYGVDSDDVETTITYITSGTLDVIIPDVLSEEEAITFLQDSISDVLGIHPRDVVITVDEEGNVEYSVSADSYKNAEVIQEVASDKLFASQITTDLSQGESGILIDSAESNDDIEVIISSTVDMTDSTGTMKQLLLWHKTIN